MTDADRQRLAAILGMLGSAHAGERDAAARQAEAFRLKHGMTWEDMLSTITTAEKPEMLPVETTEWPPCEPIQWHKVVLFACFWAAILIGALALH